MTPTPAYPQVGDIWEYSYMAGLTHRVYNVLVLNRTSDGEYLCLTFENGDVDYWIMNVDGEADNWRWLA